MYEEEENDVVQCQSFIVNTNIQHILCFRVKTPSLYLRGHQNGGQGGSTPHPSRDEAPVHGWTIAHYSQCTVCGSGDSRWLLPSSVKRTARSVPPRPSGAPAASRTAALGLLGCHGSAPSEAPPPTDIQLPSSGAPLFILYLED